ncbi:multiple epidermal growth factor-like domains protein 10 [Haliotis asinina]|uniref:multiple epidermal growth factor-like domains protein 10 n=1 Tax=Haliotis asinina TaxID=109174 RepID=UPI003531EE54
MDLLLLIVITNFPVTLRAATCRVQQHCSDCHHVIGHCLTRCEDGYFDLMCSSRCSKGCKKSLCTLNERGLQVCTEGCIPGYQGRKCTDECDNPRVGCTKCPHVCEGGYCQTDSTCISGCVGSYYGSDCKNCSSRCKSCNRITGHCEKCYPPHAGPTCEHTCDHCLESSECDNGCQHGCVPGFYGKFCDEECSVHCQPNAITSASNCSAPQERNTCIGECNRLTGACTHGCVNGRYGFNCSLQCNPRCLYGKCDATGACVEGCSLGYYGADCVPCPANCVSQHCNAKDGSCISGCTNVSYGEFCNHSCPRCLDGMCHQWTGACTKGCEASFGGVRCEHDCANDCSSADCLTKNVCKTGSTNVFLGGILASALTFAACIMLAALFYCRRRMRKKRHIQHNKTRKADTVADRDTPCPLYESLHIYSEIRENVTSSVSDPQHSDKMEDANITVRALADLHNEAENTELGDQSSQGSHCGHSVSYSHLVNDVVVNKPDEVGKYLTPVHRQMLSGTPQRPLTI